MLFHLRKGTHSASEKTLLRLAELERRSGMGSATRQWIQAIAEHAQQRIRVTDGDIARGFLETDVDYLVRKKPAQFPARIRLTRPAVGDAAGLIANLMLDEDFDAILYKTLPHNLANERFLNALSPFFYRELVQSAMELVFGLEWTKRLPKPLAKSAVRP